MKLHAEADAAGLAGAGELAEQSGEDGAGQRLLRQQESRDHTELSSRRQYTQDEVHGGGGCAVCSSALVTGRANP